MTVYTLSEYAGPRACRLVNWWDDENVVSHSLIEQNE